MFGIIFALITRRKKEKIRKVASMTAGRDSRRGVADQLEGDSVRLLSAAGQSAGLSVVLKVLSRRLDGTRTQAASR